MMKPWKGHEWGAGKVEKLMEWAADLGIKELTLYAFSMQNFNRPEQEFSMLMKLVKDTFNKPELRKKLMEKKIRVNFLGRINLFPEDVYKAMQELMDLTKNNTDYQVNFAMAYGGREEIIDATKKIGEQLKAGTLKIEDINEEVFNKNIYSNHQPDFIIRTGGDHRTSNFLIWQSHYSEWFFLEKTWPEFEKEDLIECMQQFQNRERRFGK